MTIVAAAVLPDAGDTRNHIETGAPMTASFAHGQPARREPTATAVAAAAIVVSVTVLSLIVAGITFMALAIAFPIAIPIAQAYHVPVSAADIAIAARFAELWWAFAALAIASFAAVVLVLVKFISFVSPAPQD
jgi:hypothetical protein